MEPYTEVANVLRTLDRAKLRGLAGDLPEAVFAEVVEPVLGALRELDAYDGERCHECGLPVGLVWWCHDDFLWERVTGNRREGREAAGGILCIHCFDQKAREVCPWIEWAPLNLRHLLVPVIEQDVAEARHGDAGARGEKFPVSEEARRTSRPWMMSRGG